jgi:hypothetical protein
VLVYTAKRFGWAVLLCLIMSLLTFVIAPA